MLLNNGYIVISLSLTLYLDIMALIPDSGRRRVLSATKRAHLSANERLRSDPPNPNSHD